MNRNVVLAITAVAIAALVIAAFGQHWLSGRGILSEYGLGLRDPAVQPRSGYVVAGMLTFSCLIIASFALAGAIVLEIRGERMPIAPTTVSLLALMVALVSGCVFVARKPGPYVGVGYDFYIFGVGAIAGIAASTLLAKLLASRDDDDAEG